MNYLAYLEQDNGCDYTIACGKKLIRLESTNFDDALIELNHEIVENFNGYENKLSNVKLLEVSSIVDVNVTEIYSEFEKQKLLEQQQKKDSAEYKLYLELMKKIGK